ncbi:protein MIZU-KUSSEI 1-like [Andrographis paniculata]|uniref:protein MIZU-KUSSEI 1-like n=1 Tax=Andrographis paniculata TaxID=175694 RepID=UPI0021E9375D|nr:protein MIZU-KUSSEI 1-like [Andrographis paniculata]
MMQYDRIAPSPLTRTSSSKSTTQIIPAYYTRSNSSSQHPPESVQLRRAADRRGISAFLRSLFSIFTFPSIILPHCKWALSFPAGGRRLAAAPSLGRKVTGTLFGRRRGHVSFAVQEDPAAAPVMVVELAVSTSALVREMSSAMVRIALECEKPAAAERRRGGGGRLFREPTWTMYCNGRKCGKAVTRGCTESDWHVLSTVRRVTVGAGVIPVVDDGRKSGAAAAEEGELLYMRARFERVVGNRDCEAFYMLNPDGTGGPELSIFLLRI